MDDNKPIFLSLNLLLEGEWSRLTKRIFANQESPFCFARSQRLGEYFFATDLRPWNYVHYLKSHTTYQHAAHAFFYSNIGATCWWWIISSISSFLHVFWCLSSVIILWLWKTTTIQCIVAVGCNYKNLCH